MFSRKEGGIVSKTAEEEYNPTDFQRFLELLKRNYDSYQNRPVLPFRIFRILLWFITSFLFLLGEYPILFETRLHIVFALLVASFVLIFLYNRCFKSPGLLTGILFVEAAAIGVLMFYTGGLASPFLWYALNPVLVASAFLSAYIPWIFVAMIGGAPFFYEHFPLSASSGLGVLKTYDLLLVFVVSSIFIQIFARVYISLVEQARQLKFQQESLYDNFLELTQNHLIMQSLSSFQKDAVSCRHKENVLINLCDVCENVFPFSETAVIMYDKESGYDLTEKAKFKVITPSSKNYKKLNKDMIEGINARREDIINKNLYIDRKESLAAAPIFRSKDNVAGIFLGWFEEDINPRKYQNNLLLFISFAEQVVQNIYNFKKIEHHISQLSSLYEAVEVVASRDNPVKVIDLFAAYGKNLTGCEKVIVWMDEVNFSEQQSESAHIYSVKGPRDIFDEQVWYNQLLEAWKEIKAEKEPITKDILDFEKKKAGKLICVPIMSEAKVLGLFAGLKEIKESSRFDKNEIIQTLSLLANLSAVTIGRKMAELFTAKLIVIEEQNRIANEIHDSVSQNLFNMVCGIDFLIKKKDLAPEDFREQLKSIKNLASDTSKELRVLIYRLSPRYSGEDKFVLEIENYLKNVGEMNNVEVSFTAEGEEVFLNPSIGNGFYRVIKEATFNAIRHGKPSSIKVNLNMDPFLSRLEIIDDGEGFDTEIFHKHENRKHSLGLVNMRETINFLNGKIEITSNKGEGTAVKCFVPTSPVSGDINNIRSLTGID